MADKQVYLLDENEIEKENNKFSHDNKYEEETLLMDIFRKYPLNYNIETVAIQILFATKRKYRSGRWQRIYAILQILMNG